MRSLRLVICDSSTRNKAILPLCVTLLLISVESFCFLHPTSSHRRRTRRTVVLHQPAFLYYVNPTHCSANHHHHHHHPLVAGSTSAALFSMKESIEDESECDMSDTAGGTLFTTVLLHISYDGSEFSGWSAANDNKPSSNNNTNNNNTAVHDAPPTDAPPLPRSSGRRRRNSRFIHGSKKSNLLAPGSVRSVQGALQANLAKVYGKVPMERVVVEGCSRTDKGVHARFMVAQIYCLSEEATVAQKDDGDGVFLDDESSSSSSSLSLSIPGKRKPHPRNCTDATCFVPVPKQQTTTTPPSNNRLSDLGFTLNRMLPPDIRVMRIAPTPTITTVPLADNQHHHEDDAAAASLVPVPAVIPFHPTLSCTNKTYQYQFSVGGHVQDPTQRRFTLQLKQSSREIISQDEDSLLARMRQAADCLQGRHNFAAFSGAPRGADDRRKRREENPEDTICHIFQIDIEHVSPLSLSTTWKPQPTDTYRISICGNRFLYKMARFLVGAIISVGLGKVQVGDLEQALMRGKRRGPQDVPFYCAPPDFLILHDVQYNVPIEWQSVSN